MNVIAAGPGLGEIVLTAEQIDHRVRQLGDEISADYRHRDLMLVGLLNGAAIFTADLVRTLWVPVRLTWTAVSVHGLGTGRSATVRLLKDLELDPLNRDVLIVDGAMDAGLSVSWLADRIARRQPRSLASCVLLSGASARGHGADPRYVGFDIDADGLEGYGLGDEARSRTSPHIRRIHAAMADQAGQPGVVDHAVHPQNGAAPPPSSDINSCIARSLLVPVTATGPTRS
jgi:hypoxanthine phosphoribosyltransferase